MPEPQCAAVHEHILGMGGSADSICELKIAASCAEAARANPEAPTVLPNIINQW